MNGRPRYQRVLPLIAASSALFGTVVSFRGLAVWVIVPALVCAASVGIVATGRSRWIALAIALALGPGVATLAEFLGGTGSGPITRSSLIAVSLSCMAALIACTSRPGMSLLPCSAMAVGALGLGGAGQLGMWVGVWVVLAGATLIALGPYPADELRHPRRLRAIALMLVLAGVASVGGTVLASALLRAPWTIPGTFEPSPSMAAPTSPDATLPGDQSSSATASTPDAEPVTLSWWLLAIAVVLLLMLAALVIAVLRRTVVWVRWRYLRRSLRRGSPRDQLIGAWTWCRLRLAYRGAPLPAWASPDTVGPSYPHPGVFALAQQVAPAAFDVRADPGPQVVQEAWNLAVAIDRASAGAWRNRWAAARHGPARARERDIPASSAALLLRNGFR